MQKKKRRLYIHSQLIVIILLLILQLTLLIFATLKFTQYFNEFYFAGLILSVVVVLLVANSREHPSYKLAIVIPIVIFPVFGGLFYLIFSRNRMKKIFKKSRTRLLAEEKRAFAPELPGAHLPEDRSASLQFDYIIRNGGYPLYQNTHSHYYPQGEEVFASMKEEMEKAERYIFLEYFIIAEGHMWSEILEILKEKAATGVDVRIIYDGMGCINTLPPRYNEVLAQSSIRSIIYNPFIPIASIWHNNRDHRKMMVIDGHTAFTGGINIADEYINAVSLHGHWKDTAIMLKGSAAWSFALLFLSLWSTLTDSQEDYSCFQPSMSFVNRQCWVLPFNDLPLDNLQLSRDIYLNMISRAQKQIYIMTPYFIVDNETMTALCIAARSGVDVQIITPYKSDSRYVHMVTRSFYKELLESGVKVFEYIPGFVHAKNIICDQKMAVCGSINFDFRSFYLQMECGVLLYQTEATAQMYQDFESTRELCRPVKAADYFNDKWHQRFLLMLLRLFAPMM